MLATALPTGDEDVGGWSPCRVSLRETPAFAERTRTTEDRRHGQRDRPCHSTWCGRTNWLLMVRIADPTEHGNG